MINIEKTKSMTAENFSAAGATIQKINVNKKGTYNGKPVFVLYYDKKVGKVPMAFIRTSDTGAFSSKFVPLSAVTY